MHNPRGWKKWKRRMSPFHKLVVAWSLPQAHRCLYTGGGHGLLDQPAPLLTNGCLLFSILIYFNPICPGWGEPQNRAPLPPGLHNLCHPTIRDGSTWSKFGARGEHGDVFLLSNIDALWFSENLIRYPLYVCLREVKNNLFSFSHSYLRHFSWRF